MMWTASEDKLSSQMQPVMGWTASTIINSGVVRWEIRLFGALKKTGTVQMRTMPLVKMLRQAEIEAERAIELLQGKT